MVSATVVPTNSLSTCVFFTQKVSIITVFTKVVSTTVVSMSPFLLMYFFVLKDYVSEGIYVTWVNHNSPTYIVSTLNLTYSKHIHHILGSPKSLTKVISYKLSGEVYETESKICANLVFINFNFLELQLFAAHKISQSLI